MPADLPFIDAHDVTIAASRETVWDAVQHYADARLGGAGGGLLARLLDLQPAAGFQVTDRVAMDHVDLAGRHRFSRYRLVLSLHAGPDAGHTVVRASTHAVFPGLAGRIYRALVIGTRLHVLATRALILGGIARLARRT